MGDISDTLLLVVERDLDMAPTWGWYQISVQLRSPAHIELEILQFFVFASLAKINFWSRRSYIQKVGYYPSSFS